MKTVVCISSPPFEGESPQGEGVNNHPLPPPFIPIAIGRGELTAKFVIPKTFALIIVLFFSSFFFLKAQSSDSICIAAIEIDNTLLNVFPNPTDGTFQIVYASNSSCPPPGWGGDLLINIIDKNGNTVFSETIHEFEGEYNRTIDLTSHERGVYIIEIVAGRQKMVKREVLN